MSVRRVLISAIVVVVLAAGGWYYWRERSASDPLAAFALSGNVDVHQVELAFRVTGKIAEMKVQEGDRAEAGELLAQLDRVPFENDVAAASADVDQARAQFDKSWRRSRSGQARPVRLGRFDATRGALRTRLPFRNPWTD